VTLTWGFWNWPQHDRGHRGSYCLFLPLTQQMLPGIPSLPAKPMPGSPHVPTAATATRAHVKVRPL
jgi:hypothetical protein